MGCGKVVDKNEHITATVEQIKNRDLALSWRHCMQMMQPTSNLLVLVSTILYFPLLLSILPKRDTYEDFYDWGVIEYIEQTQ